MSQPGETVVVDGDRIDEGRRSWPVVLAALIVGALIGVLIGGFYGASQPTSYEADTAVSVLPDPTLDVTSNGTTNGNATGLASLDATAYIQSQLVVINGHQLADEVQARLRLSGRPDVVATQVGETYVVQIQASSNLRSQALQVARTLGSIYDGQRTRQLTSEIDNLLASTRRQLGTVQASLSTASSHTRAGSGLTPSQTALQTQYEQLLANRSSLQASRAQVDSIVTTVSPASIASSGLSGGARDALAGLVLGAILGVVALLIVRRSVHRVRGLSDLAALGVPVLLPVQPRRPVRTSASPEFWRSAATRLLAARLHADALRLGKPVVVVGSGPHVGTSYLAAAISVALVGRGPVLLVRAGDTPAASAVPDFDREFDVVIDERRVPVLASNVPGIWLVGGGDDTGSHLVDVVRQAGATGWLVVVDGGSVTESDFAAQLARADAAVSLVVGRGTSTPADVLAATELFEAEGMTFSGAVVNDVPPRIVQRLRRLLRRREVGIGTDATPEPDGRRDDVPPTDGAERGPGGHRADSDDDRSPIWSGSSGPSA